MAPSRSARLNPTAARHKVAGTKKEDVQPLTKTEIEDLARLLHRIRHRITGSVSSLTQGSLQPMLTRDEDVDSVDILVNVYKQADHRRREIRLALRKCLRHILAQQNRDGGFPYTRNRSQSHMGIPGTGAPANVSTMFPTWFRIHTLALMAEVLPDERALAGIPFRFSDSLSMGWHRPWDKSAHVLRASVRWQERAELIRWRLWGRGA